MPGRGQRISCRADIVKDAKGNTRVQFHCFDKKDSMQVVVEKYGPDASKWPYLAKAKRSQ